MSFSFSQLLTIIFFSTLLIIILWFYLNNNNIIKRIGIRSIILCTMAIILRLLIPFEFPFVSNIIIRRILPDIVFYIKKPIITVGNYEFNVLNTLFLIWLAGIIIISFKSIKNYYLFKKEICSFSIVRDSKIQNALLNVLSNYKKPKYFNMVQSSSISIPMILGIHNPWIVLPQIELSTKEWEYILNHEVVHYYHGDLWCKLIMEYLCVIYWWNPFIYLLRKQINKALEIHTDFFVANSIEELGKIEYLECILKIAKNRSSTYSNEAVLSFINNNSSLTQRINIILEDKNTSSKFRYKRNFLLIIPVLFIVILSCFFVFEPYSISPEDEAFTVELTEKNSYLVKNEGNGYDIYVNHKYFATINEIDDSISNLKIYKDLREVGYYEYTN